MNPLQLVLTVLVLGIGAIGFWKTKKWFLWMCLRYIFGWPANLIFRLRYSHLNLPPRGSRASFADFNKYLPFRYHLLTDRDQKKYGEIVYRIIPGMGPVFFVSSTEGIEQVLSDKDTFPSRGESGLNTLIPNGLLALPTNDKWQYHRRLISKLFSQRYLQSYANVTQEYSGVLLEKWTEAMEKGEPVNAYYDLTTLAFDIICKIVFGKQLNTQREKDSIYMHRIQGLSDESARRTREPKILWNLIPWRVAEFRKNKAFADSLVRDSGFDKEPEIQGDRFQNMCQLLTQEWKNTGRARFFETRDVYEEAHTLLGAGHETTGNTMSWALLLLSQNPEKQEKLQRELSQFVQGEVPTYEEAQNLTYCRCVLYETLRLYPTVPLFPRNVVKDTKVLGYDIPAGSVILINQFSQNHSEKVWPKPLEFIPERFLESKNVTVSRPLGVPGGAEFGFVPFGAGLRSCVGQRMAMLEAIIILGSIAKKFSVTLHNPPKDFTEYDHVDITYGPKHGLWVKVTKNPILSAYQAPSAPSTLQAEESEC